MLASSYAIYVVYTIFVHARLIENGNNNPKLFYEFFLIRKVL